MTKNSKPKTLATANIFGALGYISLIFQWLWTGLVLIYPMMRDGRLEILLRKSEPAPTFEPVQFGAFTPLMTFFACFITVLVLIATALVIAKLPKTIGRQGARTTHAVAHKLTPRTIHHQPIPQKKRLKLSYQIILVLKIVALALPLLALLFAQSFETISLEIIWIIGIFCAVCTFAYFAVQQLIAWLAHLNKNAIW